MMQARSLSDDGKEQENDKLVSTLAASPPLAAMEDHPGDAEVACRLQVLAGERS
jgi:hypothetical protein